ncbi:hypothetical protein D0869_01236 [Hortaea werneckii]|uniref:Uncharacterized protein n=1 Tax=Hortaea werneckii TaxID=91943 RepID=A0A3M6XDQ6_HORWE|nr:hypothetical protein KC324_g735 [Hortaea werneckii]KAI7591365.1 hypothetical protein KC316_g2909 [Hortaea werneckii]RMX88953.1 hypothetical protein D0869_01236 [Hortaea werneckii]RMY14623.1 hypothetical protein D0868_01351 [Hortaea werneckii]
MADTGAEDRLERHLMRQRGAGSRTLNANFGFEVDFGAPSSSNPTPAEQPPVKRRKTTARGDDDPVFTHADCTTNLRDEESEQPTRNVKRATKSSRKLPVDEDDEAQRPCADHADDSFVAHTKSKKGGVRKKAGEPLTVYEDGEEQPPVQRAAAKGRGRKAAPKQVKNVPSGDMSIESKGQKSQVEPTEPLDRANAIDNDHTKPTRGTKRKAIVAPRASRRKVLAVDAEADKESHEAHSRESPAAKQSSAENENELLPAEVPTGAKASPKPKGQRKRLGLSSRRHPLAETNVNASPQKQEQNWIRKDAANEKPTNTDDVPARPAKGRAKTTRGQAKSNKKTQIEREENCEKIAEDMSRGKETVPGSISTVSGPDNQPGADAQDQIQNLPPPDQTLQNQTRSQGKAESDDQQINNVESVAGPGTPSPGRQSRTARAPRTRRPQQLSKDNGSKPENHVSLEGSAASHPTPPVSSTPNTSPQAIPEPSPSPQKKAAPPPPGTPPAKIERPAARPPKASEHEEKKKPKMRIDPETGDPSRRETVRTRKVEEGAGGLKRQLFKKNTPAPPPMAEEADDLDEKGNANVDDDMDWLFAPIEKQQRMPHQPARSTKGNPAGKRRDSYGRLGDIDLDDLCTNIVSFAGVGSNSKPESAQPAAARGLKGGRGRGMR